MKNWTTLCLLLSLNGPLVDGAAGDVLLELLGPDDLSVAQGFPHSPTQPFPVDGESLVVSALIRNDNPDPFEAIVVGEVAAGVGNTALLPRLGVFLWDPSADPDDPLFTTPEGHLAITLEPQEAFIVPVLKLWGVQVGGTPLFSPAEIGSHMSITQLIIEMLSGLDRDPDIEPPDMFLTLDRTFTVTVVPEPTVLLFLGAAAIYALKRKGSYARGRCDTAYRREHLPIGSLT